MAFRIGDGFDLYVGQTDGSINNGIWDSGLNNIPQPVGRFGVGGSTGIASLFGGASARKTGMSNQGTIWSNIAHLKALGAASSGSLYLSWLDTAANYQMTVVFDCSVGGPSVGTIFVYRGGPSGTLIATFSSAFNFGSFDHWQIQAIFSATVGEIHLRKNGSSVDTFAATGLNNITTANAYANGTEIGTKVTGNFQYFDDYLEFDSSGAAPNTWVGDVRAIQIQPTFDTAQKQLTQVSSGSLALNNGAGTATGSMSANVLYVMSTSSGTNMRATQGGVLTAATVTFNAGFTGNAKLAVYLMDGDTINFNTDSLPGTLVGVSDQVTNPTATQVFTFSTNAPIKTGFRYNYALLTDTNFVSKGNDNCGTYTIGISYGGGFPTSLIGVPQVATSTLIFPTVTASLTASNAGCVNDQHENQNVTYLKDSNVGDFDLYDLEDLNYVPGSIVGIIARDFSGKSDSGARGTSIRLKSGATSVDTTTYNPLTNYSYFGEFYNQDPNTGVAWTPSGVNALQAGCKVAS